MRLGRKYLTSLEWYYLCAKFEINISINKTEKPFSPYGCVPSDNSFRSDFKKVINIQFDIKTIIPNLTKF